MKKTLKIFGFKKIFKRSIFFAFVFLMFSPAYGARVVGGTAHEFRELMERHGFEVRTTELREGEDHRDIGRSKNQNDPNLKQGLNPDGTQAAGACQEDCQKKKNETNPAGFGFQDVAVIGDTDERLKPGAIIPHDTQNRLSSVEGQHLGVGLIECIVGYNEDRSPRFAYSTGTLVANGKVLTAAHNFYNEVPGDRRVLPNRYRNRCEAPRVSQSESRPIKPSDCMFVILRQNGNVIFESKFSDDITAGTKRPYDVAERGNDWAVVSLAEDAPSFLAPFEVREEPIEYFRQPRTVTNVAYHGDMGENNEKRFLLRGEMRAPPPNSIHACDDSVLFHYIDTNHRASGSMLYETRTRSNTEGGRETVREIVAIHVSGNSSFNVAVRINSEIIEAINRHR